MTSQGVVYVDETVDQYRDIRLPANWRIHYEPEWGSLQASLQWCYGEYPDASQYGWLADDTYPRTHGWDKIVERATGDWRLSYCADGWFSNTGELQQLIEGNNMSSGLCWGGELVRAVEAWSIPPECRQAGIDLAWLDIARPLGLHQYLPDVLVEHWNWRTGKRPKDSGDEWTRKGDAYIDRDIVAHRDWYASTRFRDAIDRVCEASAASALQLARAGATKQLSSLDETIGIARIPAARRLRLEAEVAREVQSAYANQGPA
jgi:hypothetical protein